MKRTIERLRRGLSLTWVAAVLSLILATSCSGQGGSPLTPTEPDAFLAPGDRVIHLPHDGRDRRYIVHVPTSLGDDPPLVLALHGGGGAGSQFQRDNGLDAVADREGFLAVYPDGSGRLPGRLLTWNSGTNCCGYAFDNDIDDVGFLVAVLDDLRTRIAYDERRVYVTGHSNGAMMTYRLGAEASERVTAIVPVAGAMALDDPRPSRGVPVLHIHSLDDPRALYEGGEGPPFPGTDRTVEHESVGDALAFWSEANGCDPTPIEGESRSGRGADRGQTLTRLRWPSCEGGTTVEHIRLSGVGHGWPGVSSGPLWQRLLGPPTAMIDASEEAWAFASKFQR